jgi:hypothetical protein
MFDFFTTFGYVLFGILIVIILIVFGDWEKILENKETEEKNSSFGRREKYVSRMLRRSRKTKNLQR